MYRHAARAAHGRQRWREWATGLFPPADGTGRRRALVAAGYALGAAC